MLQNHACAGGVTASAPIRFVACWFAPLLPKNQRAPQLHRPRRARGCSMPRLGIAAALALAASASGAAGAFQNGLETFDGTTTDPATWEEYNPSHSDNSISQDDAIIFSFRPPTTRWPASVHSDYTARSMTVGVGEAARVNVTVLKDYDRVLVQPWFALTDNSRGPSAYLGEDANFISMAAVKWVSQVGGVRRVNGGPATHLDRIGGVPMAQGDRYTFQIERSDLNTARFSVLDAAGNTIGSAVADVTGLPAALHPAFGVGGVGVQEGQDYSFAFDNVRVVPEPTAPAALAVGAAVLLRRRRVRDP